MIVDSLIPFHFCYSSVLRGGMGEVRPFAKKECFELNISQLHPTCITGFDVFSMVEYGIPSICVDRPCPKWALKKIKNPLEEKLPLSWHVRKLRGQ